MSAPTQASDTEATDSYRLPRSAILPPLAPVTLQPSRLLWHCQWLGHLLLAVSLVGALWPHIFRQPLWWLVLLVALAGLAFSLLNCYRALEKSVKTLGFERNWYLDDARGRRLLQPVGEVVVWQWLIVMHFRPLNGGRRLSLALLPDSAVPEDLRRLRVWLRTLYHRDHGARSHQ